MSVPVCFLNTAFRRCSRAGHSTVGTWSKFSSYHTLCSLHIPSTSHRTLEVFFLRHVTGWHPVGIVGQGFLRHCYFLKWKDWRTISVLDSTLRVLGSSYHVWYHDREMEVVDINSNVKISFSLSFFLVSSFFFFSPCLGIDDGATTRAVLALSPNGLIPSCRLFCALEFFSAVSGWGCQPVTSWHHRTSRILTLSPDG